MVSPSSTTRSRPTRSGPLQVQRARRTLAATALVAIAIVLAMLGTAAPASAHAVPVSSTPSDRSHVVTAPPQVSVTFNEAVTTDVGGLTVLNRSGERVDQGSSSQPVPTMITTDLQPDLGSGTYIANYKAISADGHPVSGSIVFAVGDATIDTNAANTLSSSSDPALDVLSKVGQFLTYVGALLAAGLAFFLQFIHDGGAERRRLSRVVQIATGVGVVGVAVTLVAQAALATGTGIGAVLDVATVRGVLKQGLGWQDLGLLVGLALCFASVSVRHKITAQSLAFYGGLITTASFVLWGHAVESPRPWLTIPADIAHVIAAAVWFGGLVGIISVLRSRIGRLELDPVPVPASAVRPLHAATASVGADGGRGDVAVLVDEPHPTAPPTAPDRGPIDDGGGAGGDGVGVGVGVDEPADARKTLRSTVAIVSRFSTLAAGSLILLTIAGLALGWSETGSIAGLTTTTYGRLLLAKVAVVAVIAFIAGYNRFFLLPWLFQDTDVEAADDGVTADDPEDPDELRAGWRSLLNTVRFEALLIVVVLALTAVLTNTPPGSTSVDTEIFQETKPFRNGQVTLTITPNTAGPNAFHVDLTEGPDGASLGSKVTAELTMPANGIGPITREMLKAGPDHFILEGVNDLAVPGEWEIVLVIRVSDFDQDRLTFKDVVR